MIGIIFEKYETQIIKEFFQLFKTPWEFYDENTSYDVVITTNDDVSVTNAKVFIIYNSGNKSTKLKSTQREKSLDNIKFIEYGDIKLPIYGNIQILNDTGLPIIKEQDSSNVIGAVLCGEKNVIQVGYDLFQEIEYLLTKGQTLEHAHIPTIELHIAILRNMILDTGIPIVEIPPIPVGYNFITCLTHDVDFVRIRDHKFDHTMFGFLYRATLGTLFDCLKGKRPWKNLFVNFKAVIILPFVHAGLARDFWMQFDRYMEIEKEIPSTYFFIPFKNRTGSDPQHRTSKRRATKYDITDVKSDVTKLRNHGDEIGLHGIDAWHDQELAYEELHRISQIANQSQIGVRMHWLCFNHDSFNILDKAGFLYDSTYGYNDAIGFRGGTSQAFQPISTRNLLEIPLHIQDSALFSPNRNHLSHSEAWEECKQVIKTTTTYGGVLTILWHQRSIAPERLYEDFYRQLLDYLRSDYDVWFATGAQAVKWFKKRRDFSFKDIQCFDDAVKIKYDSIRTDNIPPLMLRIHHQKHSTNKTIDYIDIPLSGEINKSVSLNGN